MEGPRVSGPWLGVWGGNANALPRPSFYTYDFLLQATWQHHMRRIQSRGVDCVDTSPRDRNQNTCAKFDLSDGDRRLTCRHVDAMGASNSHQTCDRERPHDLHRTAGWRKITNHDRRARSWPDRRAIVARSSCGRGHQSASITRSNDQNFSGKNSL